MIKNLLLLIGIYAAFASAQYKGDDCVVERTQAAGICKPIYDCQTVLTDLQRRRSHTRCGFEGRIELVCCPGPPPQITTTEAPIIDENSRVSERKCKEYSKAMYEYEYSQIDHQPIELDKCGHKVVPLIVGGEFAKPREFPHMALIGFDIGKNSISWSCGGTLISEQHVLTAGHCRYSNSMEAKYIRLGELNILSTDEDAQPEDFNISQIIPHPNYRSFSKYNDIAIYKMDRKVTLNPYHRPACLSTSFNVPEKKAIATGWGNTEWAGNRSSHLLKVTLDKFSHEECNASYVYEINKKLKNGIDDNIQMCAGSKTESKDSCQGDSGGPLQVFHPSLYCMYSVIGVTSFGILCGNVNVPGIYTRVYPYLDWIESVVWG